jgi:hypothetical protein
MDVEIGGRAKALDEGHRAGVGFGAFESCLFNQKGRYDPVDDLQDRREGLGMCSEQQAQRDRKREHPLPHRHPGDEVIDQVGGGLRHVPGPAGGAKSTPLTGERRRRRNAERVGAAGMRPARQDAFFSNRDVAG